MNKMKLALLAAVAVAGTVQADTFDSATEVGLLQVNSACSNTIVAIPWQDLAGGAISVSNVVKTANLTNGDRVYVYTGTAYNTWELQDNVWQPVSQYNVNSKGQVVATTTPTASDATLEPGQALWLWRQNASADVPFYLWGQYNGNGSITSTVEKASMKWSLLANPTGAAVTLDDIPWVNGDGPAEGDRIRFTTVNGKAFGVMRQFKDGKWSRSDPIAPGMGVWYISNGGGGKVSWSQEQN